MAACVDISADGPVLRVVACEAHVQSHKRGVAANHLAPEDFRALAPGVSWFYNWHYRTDDLPPDGVAMEFVPMVWGNRPEALAGAADWLKSAPHLPRAVLAINEPNLRGQAFIPPATTATLYQQIEDLAAPDHLPVVGPNMALGSATGDSITADDPIQHRPVTYTFMVPFLQAFLFDLGRPTVNALAVHTYGPIGELKWAVQSLHDQFKCPIWVTEFAEWKAADADAEREFLIQAGDFLERTPYVQGYAWFKERTDDEGKISLLAKTPGELTDLGRAYVDLPVHDADLYYRIPGKLPAGNYVDLQEADIVATPHGSLLISADNANATVNYNLQVDTAGAYHVKLRLLGTGTVEAVENASTLASAQAGGSEVEELDLPLQLPAGAQTLTLRLKGAGITLQSLEFSPAK